jgi:hypothetical protein
MTLIEWISGELSRLNGFVEYWRSHHEEDAEHFPDELPPGEWDEQYKSWSE